MRALFADEDDAASKLWQMKMLLVISKCTKTGTKDNFYTIPPVLRQSSDNQHTLRDSVVVILMSFCSISLTAHDPRCPTSKSSRIVASRTGDLVRVRGMFAGNCDASKPFSV